MRMIIMSMYAGKGDVLREFADAANRWGIKICYYLQGETASQLQQRSFSA